MRSASCELGQKRRKGSVVLARIALGLCFCAQPGHLHSLRRIRLGRAAAAPSTRSDGSNGDYLSEASKGGAKTWEKGGSGKVWCEEE